MSVKVLTTSGAIKQGTTPSVDLAAATGTLTADKGGTGRTSHTAYAVLCGGTTTTSAQQSIAGVGTSGQVLTSNGASNLPTFQAAAGGFEQTFVLASDVDTAADTVHVDVTGLVFDFEASSYYWVDIVGVMSSAASSTGQGLSFNTSVAVSRVTIQFVHQLATTGTLTGGHGYGDDTTIATSSGISGNGALVPIMGMGTLISSVDAGTAQLRLNS